MEPLPNLSHESQTYSVHEIPGLLSHVDKEKVEYPAYEQDQEQRSIEQVAIVAAAARYVTDSAVYASECATDVVLISRISASLRGEVIRSSTGTSGLGYASKEVGLAVAGCLTPKNLFTTDMPHKAAFEDLLSRRVGGVSGQMLTRLLMDVIYPYAVQEDDGYQELPATPTAKAFSTITTKKVGRDNYVDESTEADFCSLTERHFVRADKLIVIEHDGCPVAIQKHRGDHTALLLRPAIINGVRIPVGAVLTIDQTPNGPTFAFGRLTPFCFEDAAEGMRQVPEVFNQLVDRKKADQFVAAYAQAHRSFRVMVGGEGEGVVDGLVDDYLAVHPGISIEEAANGLIRQLDEKLTSPFGRHIINMIRTENEDALVAAHVTRDDMAQYHVDRTDPHDRDIYMQHAIQARIECYRKYGPEVVREVELLINKRDELMRQYSQGSAARPMAVSALASPTVGVMSGVEGSPLPPHSRVIHSLFRHR